MARSLGRLAPLHLVRREQHGPLSSISPRTLLWLVRVVLALLCVDLCVRRTLLVPQCVVLHHLDELRARDRVRITELGLARRERRAGLPGRRARCDARHARTAVDRGADRAHTRAAAVAVSRQRVDSASDGQHATRSLGRQEAQSRGASRVPEPPGRARVCEYVCRSNRCAVATIASRQRAGDADRRTTRAPRWLVHSLLSSSRDRECSRAAARGTSTYRRVPAPVCDGVVGRRRHHAAH